MRHIFDQYHQPENKLTHALVSSLAQDESLLREFIQWAVKKSIQKKKKIHILEQSVPGLEELQEDLAEKKGLPDAWIYTDDGWCLLIESKIECALTSNQIERHRKRAKLKGFSSIQMVVIVLNRVDLPDAIVLTWREIYAWGMKHRQKFNWAKIFTEYFEIVEKKMIKEDYLKSGTLTKFSGIPFASDYPYSYLEAKRLLKLIIDELKHDKQLMQELGIDTTLEGRPAITGKEGLYVWDFLRIKESRTSKNHTEFPHLTFSIHHDFANACITIPNGTNKEIRDRLFNLDYADFEQVFRKFLKASDAILKIDKNIKPFVNIMQRHYYTQRSMPVTDALIRFDLRTSFANSKAQQKYQPQWLKAVYDVMKDRHANLQMQVGFEIDYSISNENEKSVIRSQEGLKFFKLGIKSLEIILAVLLNRK
jgi:hypothetical protein